MAWLIKTEKAFFIHYTEEMKDLCLKSLQAQKVKHQIHQISADTAMDLEIMEKDELGQRLRDIESYIDSTRRS